MEGVNTAPVIQPFQWTKDEIEVLSEVQRDICMMKASGKSCYEIVRKHSLHSLNNISTCIINTIQGNIWAPGQMVGGRPCFLSDVEICTFKRKINAACYDLDCLNTKHALQMILELKDFRYARGSFIAQMASQKVSLPKSYTETLNKMMT